MKLLLAWAVFPLALTVLSLGCGLLLERVGGGRWPRALLPPGGFALIVAVVYAITSVSALARLALPAVVVVALAGYVLGRDRLRGRPSPWVLVAAAGVFVVFGAPVFLSGVPSFAGSLVLPDTAHQLVLADRLAHHGHDYASLPISTYQATVYQYLVTRYPVGAQAVLGVLSPFGFQDLVWLYQPFLSFMGALTALAVAGLLAPWVRSPGLRAAAGFLAAQPVLVVGYALQGSIKEVGAVAVYWTAIALLAWAFADDRRRIRRYVPGLVAGGALVTMLGLTAGVYIGVPVVVLAGVWVFGAVRDRRRVSLRWIGLAAGVLVVVALLSAGRVRTAYQQSNNVLSQANDLGNLAHPLKVWEAGGIWLGQDFRYDPRYQTTTTVLVVIVAVLGLLGLWWCWRRRAVAPALGIGSLVVTAPVLLAKGSPYADGKILMLLSPAVLLAAALGAVWLTQGRSRLRRAGYALLAVLGAGVLASNALAYRGVQEAPYHRYDELLSINDQFAGKGAAFFNEYDEYAGYLLRDTVPLAAPPLSAIGPRLHDPSRKPDAVRDKLHRPSVKTPFDIDDMTNAYLQSVSLIVLRRSPVTSRPPANFRRVRAGTYYDVWQRRPGTKVLAHLPLGNNALDPGGIATCGQVTRLAARARKAGARLAYATRPLVPRVFPLTPYPPKGWFEYGAYPRSVVPAGIGRVDRVLTLPAGGGYRVWIEGSFGRRITVKVDGREVGSVSGEYGNAGQFFPLSIERLGPGRHRVELDRASGSLAPGSGDNSRASLQHIGPVVFSPAANERTRVQTLSPSRATELCGRRLDWIEVVRG